MSVLDQSGPATRAAPLRAELRRALRAERRRTGAWLVSAAVVAAATLGAGAPELALVAGAIGVCFTVWSARLTAGLTLAIRDLEKAEHPARRAVVALLHDPNPRAVRPLLVVWPEAPRRGERPPAPRSVWRCDDELTALESDVSDPELHEAWLDSGPRGWSTTRWVCADAGIAVPHRRALFGRIYVRMLLRAGRSGAPAQLTVPDPHTLPDGGVQLPLGGSLLRSVAWRIVALGLLSAVVAFFA